MAYQQDLPYRGSPLHSAPNSAGHQPCLSCSQQHQQHKGSHDCLVYAVAAEAECDIRYGLEVCYHINGARWVPCEVHPGIPASHQKTFSVVWVWTCAHHTIGLAHVQGACRPDLSSQRVDVQQCLRRSHVRRDKRWVCMSAACIKHARACTIWVRPAPESAMTSDMITLACIESQEQAC